MAMNRLKTMLAQGLPVLNGWLSIPSPLTAEVLAAQGYDALTVDMQHGLIDYADMVAMLQAMRASGVVPLARVPWLDPAAIMKTLDAGALGVICPMISNRAQAEEFVSYMRYPPHGTRSFGPTRAMWSLGADYYNQANDQVMCFAMIETAEGVENLDEICSTPGLDGVYIGPADLTIGVTNGRLPPGFDRQEEEMIAVIKQILAASKKAGIHAVMHCGTPEYAARAFGWGFPMATLLNDLRMLSAAAAREVQQTRDLMAKLGDQAN